MAGASGGGKLARAQKEREQEGVEEKAFQFSFPPPFLRGFFPLKKEEQISHFRSRRKDNFAAGARLFLLPIAVCTKKGALFQPPFKCYLRGDEEVSGFFHIPEYTVE